MCVFLKIVSYSVYVGVLFHLAEKCGNTPGLSCGVGGSGSGRDFPQGCVRSWNGGCLQWG